MKYLGSQCKELDVRGEGKGPYSLQNPLKGGNRQDEAGRNGVRASPDTSRRPASCLALTKARARVEPT